MDITQKIINDHSLLLKVQGQLSLDTIDSFKNEVISFINNGYIHIILQLEHLTYISSAGIQVLYQILDHLQNKSGQLAICCPTPTVKKIFEVISLESDIPIYANEQEALNLV